MSPRLAPLVLASALAALAWAVAAPAPARADVVPLNEVLRPGQSFAGDVPAGETVRIGVELAEGAKLRLRFTFRGSSTDQYLPANFQRVSVIGPDGKPVPFDTARDSFARYDPRHRTSTFQTNDWPAPKGGVYTFSITHKTKFQTFCSGKAQVIRTKKIPLAGTLESDAADRTWSVPLQPNDAVKVVVRKKGKTAGAPYLASYTPVGGSAYTPSQRMTKKGSTVTGLYASSFGTAQFVVGPQLESSATGEFKGTLTVRATGRYGKVPLVLSNPPGVPLSVRNVEGALDVTWASSGAGVDYDGQYVLVTGETAGTVQAKYYFPDLSDPSPFAYPTVLVSSADFPGTTPVQGHRLLFSGGFHYVAAANAGGTSALVARFPYSLARNGFSSVVDNSTTPVNDLFAVTDDLTLWVGVPNGASGHAVHGFDITSLASVGAPVTIGGPSNAQAPGAGALYRGDQNVFEVWAPTAVSSSANVPSDLSHGLYTPNWNPLLWEPARIADTVTEVMPTAVVFDPDTGATILHWVEPTQDASGFGIVHRAVFDALGILVPGSEANLGTVRYRRPAAFLTGGALFVALEGVSNPVVVRYALLRH